MAIKKDAVKKAGTGVKQRNRKSDLEMRTVSPLEKSFCEEYLVNGNNLAGAYRSVFMAEIPKEKQSDAMSDMARQKAFSVVSKPHVREYIMMRKKEIYQAHNIYTDLKVFNTLIAIIDADATDIYDENFKIRPVSEWSSDLRKAVKKITVKDTKFGKDVSVEMMDKNAAIHKLSLHIDFYRKSEGAAKKRETPALTQNNYFGMDKAQLEAEKERLMKRINI
jgi:hypothetical protein